MFSVTLGMFNVLVYRRRVLGFCRVMSAHQLCKLPGAEQLGVKMKLIFYCVTTLVIGILTSPSWSNACSRKIDYFEKSEGTTLKYWTMTPIAFITVAASSLATGSESQDTNKFFSILGALGLYVGACGYGSGNQFVDQEWMDAHPQLRDRVTPKPSTAEGLQQQHIKFYQERASIDKALTIMSALVNTGNALVAREEASRIVGFTGAFINIAYYFIDPNDVRRYENMRISFQFTPLPNQTTAAIAWSF